MTRLHGRVCAAALLLAGATGGVSGQVVVSQGFGGSVTGFVDYAELLNKGTTPVNLAGWSLQVSHNATTDPWEVVPLSGTIQPGQYFLVKLNNSTANRLPTPDVTHTGTSSTIMFSDSGALAVVRNTTAIATGICPAGLAQVEDFVHWDDAALTCFEGSGLAPETSSSQAVFRRNGGCSDTQDNASDFVLGPINPRNSSTNAFVSGGFRRAFVGTTVTVTATRTSVPCNPLGTITSATVDLTQFGLPSQTLFDDGAHGDGAAGDNVFGAQVAVPAAQAVGSYRLPVTLSDGTVSITSGFTVQATAMPQPENDDCATALDLSAQTSYAAMVDNLGANDGHQVECLVSTQYGLYDVWYRYTTGASRKVVRIDETSTGAGGQDVYITIYTGTCSALTMSGCTGGDSRDHRLEANTTYYFQISQQAATGQIPPLPTDPGPAGPMNLSITIEDVGSAPANDTCATATNLGSLASPVTATYSVLAAEHDDPVVQNSTSCHSVFELQKSFYATWFRFTPPSSGALTIAETGGLDATYSIFTGSNCADKVYQLCEHQGGGASETFTLFAGQTYFIQVSEYDQVPPSADATVTFTFAAAPANDTCAGATPLTGPFPMTITQSIANATADDDTGGCSASDAVGDFGVWFTYTAPADGDRALILNENNSSTFTLDVTWRVFRNGCGSPSQRCLFTDQGHAVAVPRGTTVHILAHVGTSLPTADAQFVFDVVEPSTNTSCETAFNLNGAGVSFPYNATFNNLFAADSTVGASCFSTSFGRRALWFRYTAPADGRIFLQTSFPSGEALALTDWAVYAPTNAGDPCNSLTQRDCNTNDSTSFGVEAGVTYYILTADGSPNGSPDPVPLKLTFTPNNATSGNDSCATAEALTLPRDSSITTVRTLNDDADVSCGSASTGPLKNGVWYSITPSVNTRIGFVERTSVDAVIAVFQGCGGAEFACDDGATTTDAAFVNLLGGTSYRILVGTDSSSAAGATSANAYDISFFNVPALTNDTCATATNIQAFPFNTSFNADDANPDAPSGGDGTGNPSCNSSTTLMQDSAWYRIQPTAGGTLGGTIEGIGMRATWAIYSTADGSCPTSNAARIACGAEASSGSAAATVSANLPVLAGNGAYFLQVGRFGTTAPAGIAPIKIDLTFTGSVQPPCVADVDGNGQVQVNDIFAFLSRWFSDDPRANVNGDGVIDVADIFAFLSRWFAGC